MLEILIELLLVLGWWRFGMLYDIGVSVFVIDMGYVFYIVEF